jgi:hypothetical protein
MQALIAEYGFEGYGRFWALNERIAASGGAAIDVSKKVNKMALARSLGLNEAGTDEFLAFLSDPEIDLVNISGEGILTTDRTREDFKITQENREKARDRMQKTREKNVRANNGDVRPNNSNIIEENDDVRPNNGDVRPNFDTERVDRVERSTERERNNNSGGRSRSLSSRAREGACAQPVENPGPSGALPPPLDVIKTESEAAGFVIPDNLAKHLADTTDPPWLSGPHSYFRFVAEQIRDSYRKNPKTEAELRKIYLAALWNGWENFRKTYPAWREQQERAEAQRKTAGLKKNRPPHCPNCGSALNQVGKCPGCGGFYDWDDADAAWVFGPFDQGLVPPKDKIRPRTVPKAGDDIIF